MVNKGYKPLQQFCWSLLWSKIDKKGHLSQEDPNPQKRFPRSGLPAPGSPKGDPVGHIGHHKRTKHAAKMSFNFAF